VIYNIERISTFTRFMNKGVIWLESFLILSEETTIKLVNSTGKKRAASILFLLKKRSQIPNRLIKKPTFLH